MHDRDPEDDELAQRLEAYSQARLSPDLSASTRMRSQVMAAAHRHAIRAGANRTRRSPWRRSMTALLAAGLTLAVGVGSVAAAQPGGPLYTVRIWAETLTLPATANERAHAELRRLDERLAEAAAATAAGDTNAANAALEAYGAIVRQATSGAGDDAAANVTLDTGVKHNIEVLRSLSGRVPEQARDAIERAIERAIDRSDSALDTIREPRGNRPEATPTKEPKPEATDRPARTANPNRATSDPAETPKPRPTPKAGGKAGDPPGNGAGIPATGPGAGQGN